MAYSCANRAGKVIWQSVLGARTKTGMCCKVSKRLIFMLIAMGLLVLLLVAWFDGGRVEQRMIVEPVNVPENTL